MSLPASVFAFPPSQFSPLPLRRNPGLSTLPRTLFLRDRYISAGVVHRSRTCVLSRRYLPFRPHNSHFYSTDETLVSRSSLVRDSSRTARYLLAVPTALEWQLSRADIRFSALATHTSTPQTKPGFIDPPSHIVPPGQIDMGWSRSPLQNLSRPASLFALPPSQSTLSPLAQNPRFSTLPRVKSLCNSSTLTGIARCSRVRALPRQYSLFRPCNSHFYPSDETPVYRPSLTRCSSRRDRCRPESLTTPERESSRADICLSALATHTSTPQMKPSSSGPPSRAISLGQLDTCWQYPLLQNGSSPAPISALPPSQFSLLPPRRTPGLSALPRTLFLRER